MYFTVGIHHRNPALVPHDIKNLMHEKKRRLPSFALLQVFDICRNNKQRKEFEKLPTKPTCLQYYPRVIPLATNLHINISWLFKENKLSTKLD